MPRYVQPREARKPFDVDPRLQKPENLTPFPLLTRRIRAFHRLNGRYGMRHRESRTAWLEEDCNLVCLVPPCIGGVREGVYPCR